MYLKNNKSIDKLDSTNEFRTVLENLENDQSSESIHLKAIAHYKLGEYKKAESLFESLNKSCPTVEICAFLIICKLKLKDLNNATILYKELCKNENKNIISDLESDQIEQVKNRCLFLLSIPIETSHDPNRSLHEALNHFDYKTIINRLKKNKQNSL